MTGPVIFFDGVCGLCSASVQFIIRHDHRAFIRFAPLQSAAGKAALAAVLQEYNTAPDALILLDNGRYYAGAEAALRVAAYLDGNWKLLAQFDKLPRFLLTFFYRLVARNRYRLFGRRKMCLIPPPELRQRFIDTA